MSFISYAQNNEDVLLWRALGHIRDGFYIDVGANDPVEHSVTKAFYDAGWRGVNVEPLPAFHQAFLDQRPRDVNLAIAAGASDGSLTLYDVPAVNGWASPDPAVAAAHQADGHVVRELTVPVRTLAGICREHARGEIHFLKIDVEGFEAEVLRGMDFAAFRPWLLVVEATLPNSRVTNHGEWEALVTARGYRYAWFDGLNRYYVSDRHPELLAALTVQPNVFDDFISHHLDTAWRNAEAAAADAARAHARVAQLGEQEHKAEQRAARDHALSLQAIDHARALLLKYEDADKRAAQAHAEVEVVRADSAVLRASLAGAGADLVRLDGELAHANAELARVNDTLAHTHADLARVSGELARTDGELARANAELRRTDGELARLDAELARAGAARVRKEAELARSGAARAHAEAELLARSAALAEQSERAARLQAELDTTWQQANAAQAWGADLEQRLLATLASTSWRLTRPLRALGTLVHTLRSGGVRGVAVAALRPLLVAATRDERARRLLIPLMRRMPDRGLGLSQAINTIKQPPAPAPAPVAAASAAEAPAAPPDEILNLSAAARRVFADLQHARTHLNRD